MQFDECYNNLYNIRKALATSLKGLCYRENI